MKEWLFLKKWSKLCYVVFGVCGCLGCRENEKIEWGEVSKERKGWRGWWWEGNGVRSSELDRVMGK